MCGIEVACDDLGKGRKDKKILELQKL